ncbi:hypothetical protein LEP1GSC060_0784 [Leptospira weilii serovar Ranarum str. ICFT]|uniref:PF10934 family protein n=1 Tax=Leptospira weilii serovar Ranarum str. ICFT TaxID=1218598 RepID=N1WJ81_9LEPT|nr:hypothetical protein [Leptospira weilii]EMY78975.1 hypothetical protein LEP1GSC060_0784 [Leptospira weilii serovar Ranarum str. ICFT]
MKGLKIENGDVVRRAGKPILIQDLEYYSQRIKHAIRLTLGESEYEPLAGIDWQTIFSERVPKERVLAEIKKILQKDPETISIESIELIETNDPNRKLNIQFSAITKYGIVTEGI